MKKLFFTIILLVVCYSLQAQWTDSGSNITTSDNVGIGTTSPTTQLHLKHSSAHYNPGGLVLENNISTSVYNLINSGNNLYIGYNTNVTNNYPQSSYSARLYIKYDGNVGIGTTNPDSKLSVNGTIHAKEVKVDLSGWSDFVFNESYNLRTLEATEKFISENNHLPDIPSEAEVKANGINLGEMDAKLLQKIEELTLYLIEQNKQNQSQQVLIELLQKEVAALKN